MNGEDILFAMTSLGFENYGEALKIYLARYREVSTRETPWALLRSALTFDRTLLPVVSISALVNPALREKLVLLLTALTPPFLSATLWIHPRKVPTTSLATLSRISLSTRGTIIESSTYQRARPFLPFRCIYVAIGLPRSGNAYRHGPQISVAGYHKLGSGHGSVETWRHERRFKLAKQYRHDHGLYAAQFSATLKFGTLTVSMACNRLQFLLYCVLSTTNEGARGREVMGSMYSSKAGH